MFPERLKKCRLSRRYTQREMTEFLNCHRNTYQNYESGTREPNFATLVKLADFFDVTTDYLLGRTE